MCQCSMKRTNWFGRSNMDVENILYIVNMERGGLYCRVENKTLNQFDELEYDFLCINGKGVSRIEDYDQYIRCNADTIKRLITTHEYVPIYSEKEALPWKLRNAN
jgi:hypothetical protein